MLVARGGWDKRDGGRGTEFKSFFLSSFPPSTSGKSLVALWLFPESQLLSVSPYLIGVDTRNVFRGLNTNRYIQYVDNISHS